jgi:beta-galactosidase
MLLLDTATPLAYYDHPFFGKYPAITENHFGKGIVTYEGTVLSDELQRKVLERVLEQAQINGPESKFPAAIRVKHGVNRSGHTIHYFFNFSADPQQVSYPYSAGVELLSGIAVKVGADISLGPWGVAIVEQ